MFSLFFFSSRRRHTRSLCDWSSDVCSSDLLKRMLCKGEHLKIGYIALVERLHKSVNGTIATTTQFAPNTVNRDMSCTCYDLCAILRHYVLYMEGFEGKWFVAVQIFLFECLEDLLARKFLA